MCRWFESSLGHQNLTPNPSLLGVSISTSRKPRGVRAHSACAGGGHGLGHRAASSTLFCPLFSQNLHQLFRRGKRTLAFVAIAYVRASYPDREKLYRPLPPSPQAVERMLETMRWVQWLEVKQRHLVWMRANRYEWQQIGRRFGCDRNTAARRWNKAIAVMVGQLNARLQG